GASLPWGAVPRVRDSSVMMTSLIETAGVPDCARRRGQSPSPPSTVTRITGTGQGPPRRWPPSPHPQPAITEVYVGARNRLHFRRARTPQRALGRVHAPQQHPRAPTPHATPP